MQYRLVLASAALLACTFTAPPLASHEPYDLGAEVLASSAGAPSQADCAALQPYFAKGRPSSVPTKTIAASPISGYTWYESRLMYRRIIATVEGTASKAAAWWFMGDFRKALAYMENWPVTVVQAPNNSEAEFLQDIVLRFKASERGAAAVLQPRAVVKCYNT